MVEAAKREGLLAPPAAVPVTVRRGGLGIHDGRTWHGVHNICPACVF